MKILLLLFPVSVFCQSPAVGNVWDLQGKVLTITQTIMSGLTIKNAIIQANPYIQIFDTTVTLVNCKTREFSTAWFGAKSTIADNSVYLQKSISTCIANNISNLYCADSYTYSTSLLAFNLVGNRYIGFGLNFYGDGDKWNQKQTLTYTGSEFGFGVRVAKGGSFRGIALRGTNTGSGIVVDYNNLLTASGSTGYFIENCFVGNFDINYNISPTGAPWNGDIIYLNNIHSGKCRVGVRSGQPQNKGNEINGFYSWDSCQIAFQIINGNWIIRGGNIAGYCAQMLDVSLAGWNTFSIQGMSAERLLSLGNVYAYNSVYLPPVNLQDMDIRFIPGPQVLFSANTLKIRISNSFLVFYNGICCQEMHFSGPFIWDNNDCGYCEIIDKDIQYIIPVKPNPITFR